jgi:acetyl esterase/lipase
MKHLPCGSLKNTLILLLLLGSANLTRPVRAQETPSLSSHRDVVFAEVDGHRLKLDLYVPKTDLPPRLVVWIHGGGWRSGSKNNPRIKSLTEDGYAIASISYRFTDKAIFPAQIHDCKAAVRWLRANAERYGYDADWIAVAGSSAGGHLALLMGTSGGVAELEGTVGGNLDQSSTVQAVIDYFGPSDFVLRGKTQPERSYTQLSGSFALLGGVDGQKLDSKTEQFASPTHYVSDDDPPLLVFHGEQDQTVLLDQSQRIVNRYSEVGLDARLVVLKQAGHGGKQFFGGQHAETAKDFLNSHRPAVRVLTIGNSFAQNACRYLNEIAGSSGDTRLVIGTANLGGCTLEKHATLAAQSAIDPAVKPYTDKQDRGERKMSLQDYLVSDRWDFVTLQQMSALSYKPETFHPYIDQLVAIIQHHAPDAKILIHQTWAYRQDSPILTQDKLTQQEMYARLRDAYADAARQFGCRIIPVGTAFQLARSAPGREVLVRDPDFDFDNPVYPNRPRQTHSLVAGWNWKKIGGKPQLRLDFKHGNTQGCFLAGLVWYESLTGNDARETSFVPEGVAETDAVFFRTIAHSAVAKQKSGAAATP